VFDGAVREDIGGASTWRVGDVGPGAASRDEPDVETALVAEGEAYPGWRDDAGPVLENAVVTVFVPELIDREHGVSNRRDAPNVGEGEGVDVAHGVSRGEGKVAHAVARNGGAADAFDAVVAVPNADEVSAYRMDVVAAAGVDAYRENVGSSVCRAVDRGCEKTDAELGDETVSVDRLCADGCGREEQSSVG
jgi:hypothetical protein